MINPLPLPPSRWVSNREARPPLMRPGGSFFLALESILGGCGGSGVEVGVAPETLIWTRSGEAAPGEICGERFKGHYREWVSDAAYLLFFFFFEANSYASSFLNIRLSPKDNDIKLIWWVSSKGKDQTEGKAGVLWGRARLKKKYFTLTFLTRTCHENIRSTERSQGKHECIRRNTHKQFPGPGCSAVCKVLAADRMPFTTAGPPHLGCGTRENKKQTKTLSGNQHVPACS